MVRQIQSYQQICRRVVGGRQLHLVFALALMLTMGLVGSTAATQTSSSSNYSVTETQFGGGSAQQECSATYCSQSAAGDTAVGSGSSASYSAQFGSNTTDEPLLEEIVTGGTQDMGVLDVAHTGAVSVGISVRSYLSSGYTLQITGSPPSQGVHSLTPIWPTPSTSQQGAEQFGINLVANTTPAIGSDPVQVPSSAGSFGTVTTNYSTPDLFAYQDGDVVAQSLSSSGETDYTMSIIINVSNTTLGGRYSGTFSAVAVPVY